MMRHQKASGLTDAEIKKLPLPERDRLIPAGGRDGLYLRHRTTDRKTWLLRRRVDGAWRVKTLGDWPVLTTLNARRKASIAVVAKSAPLTFGKAAQKFYDEMILPRYRSAPEEARAYFVRDCAKIASRRLDKVTRADLVAVVREKAIDTPNAASKLLVLLKQFFSWASIGELIEADPAVGLTAKKLGLPSYEPRERVLTDDEIRALWALPGEPYGRLLQFATLTACRIGEAIQFDPEQVVGEIWTVPRTKNGRPHSIPLAPTAAALAAAGWPPRKYASLHTFVVTGECGWRPHDLRRTAATRMRDAGVAVEVIESILNHSPPRLVRVYQRPNMMPATREALVTLQGVIERITGIEKN